ncbi:MAG: NTP transferase domain-containing protein, partial [Lachnospiraceae bacterium]|nr:NTP transferase domain-containing protein [Lachnospiraceae bacterium]
MKALILNSGMGTRMGVLASEHPKCMTEISPNETIISRQLTQLADVGIDEVIITTGRFSDVLEKYCRSLNLPVHIIFVNNPEYKDTNYIYSIYCAREYLDDDIILMHGDLVFENEVLDQVLESDSSCMTVSKTLPLPEKDFKAVIKGDRIVSVGTEFFDDAVAAQPLYKFHKKEWIKWLDKICLYCESGKKKVYAENALNELKGDIDLFPLDVKSLLCGEIDDANDLVLISSRLEEVESRTVYMSFSTDVVHGGHIAIIKKAQRLGKLTIGVLSDEAVASYKRFPLLPASERKKLFSNIKGVFNVIDQNTLSYKSVLESLKPDFVVHGDDWKTGFQKPIRDEVVSVLLTYGGKLVEYPYSEDSKYREIEQRTQAELSLPDVRRGRLKKLLNIKGFVTALEAHNGITGLIVEKTAIYREGA